MALINLKFEFQYVYSSSAYLTASLQSLATVRSSTQGFPVEDIPFLIHLL